MPNTPNKPTRPKKLLLADDSVVIQKLVGLSFANEDVEIVSTDNGDDAVSMAREIRPDVILADVVMPGKSGYEVCEAIKQDSSLAATPVLLLTGTFEAFDEGRAAQAGADGQITKPFEAQALVERVTEVMNAPPPAPTAEPARAAANATDALFDAQVSTLSPEPARASTPSSTPRDLDRTPSYDPRDEEAGAVSSPDLFGAPGEGASDVIDETVGSLAIGQSVAEEQSAASGPPAASKPVATDAPTRPSTAGPVDVGPRIDADAGETVVAAAPLPPLSTAGSRPAATPEARPGASSSGASSDPLDELGDDLALGSALPTPPPEAVDLDAAFAAPPSEDEPTIYVARDDVNAKTSPSLDAEEEPTPAEDLTTVHAPTADIDQARAAAPAPPSPVATRAEEGRAVSRGDAGAVADLDAELEIDPEDEHAPLDIGPDSRGAEDLDYAFDVSEQVAADDPRADTPVDESFSSLMDISESTVLRTASEGDRREETPAETIVAGYDVSSSDLVADPTDTYEAQAPPAPPIPEPEALVEVPELPAAHEPSSTPEARTRASEPAARNEPITGRPDLFAGLATGSVMDEIDASTGTSAEANAEPDDEDDDRWSGSIASQTTPPAPEPAGALDTEREPTPDTPASPADDEDLAIAVGPARSEVDRPVADLSPLMEQRIRESLEKVAWEAFSDLSETIVKQVMGRVEQIAWEVIPEMAETLVREEIRKMKGEED